MNWFFKRTFQISHLWLETTRRCNRKCQHCARGQMQKLDMTCEIVNKVFDDVKHIDTLYLTGGEPALKPDIVGMIAGEMRKRKIRPARFSIASNGSFYSRKLVEAMDLLYEICTDKERCEFGLSANRYSMFNPRVSLQYHMDKRPYMKTNIADGSFGNTMKELVREGRAMDTDIYGDGVDFKQDAEGKFKPEKKRISNLPVYVSALGDVLSCNALSYEDMEKYSKGSLKRTGFQTILERSI